MIAIPANSKSARSAAPGGCPLCVRPTPRCRADADGRQWCAGAHGYMPGFEVVAEGDGLTAYVVARPAPPPAPPLAPLPTCADVTEQLGPDQRDYLRACERIVAAAGRAAQFRAAGALAEAERAELDRLEALGDKQAAYERAAQAHRFGECAVHDLYRGGGPVAEAIAELQAKSARTEADVEELAAAVARLERAWVARGTE